jgi:uncharacterized cupin superfamily protein
MIKTKDFTLFQTGRLTEWGKYIYKNNNVPSTEGKLFLKELLGLTGMEVSINKLKPGEGIPFYHKHKNNEELYIFLKGRGQFQLNGNIFDIQEGSVVRVYPEVIRAFRNNSSEDLYFIVIQAKVGSFSGEGISDGIGSGSPVQWKPKY